MAEHSHLGASSAHRWMACPGSIRLAAGVKTTSSRYAKEGTAAHELAEACLRAQDDPFNHVGETIVVEGDSFEVDDGMADAVQVFVHTVLGDYDPKTDVLAIEQRFDLSRLHPGMFGTCDAVIYKPVTKKLIVYDYKHGRGYAVESTDNPQLKYYGIGALLAEKARPLDEVSLVIVQPRAPHPKGPVRPWPCDPVDLLDFTGELVKAAKATEDPMAPLVPGDHCTFCPAAGFCPALRGKSLESAQASFTAHPADWTPPEPSTLTREQRAAVMRRAEQMKDWIGAVQQYEHSLAEGGDVMPGWKLVDKRASRKWLDEKAAETAVLKLLDGYDAKKVSYTAPKLKSPAQIEATLQAARKMTKKAAGEAIATLTVKESSGTNLVPDEDVRAEVKAAVLSAFTPIAPSTPKALFQ